MSSDEPKKISVMMILEVLGRPPEHLTLTLENLAKQMGEEKGVVVKKKDIKEPILMEKKVGSLEKGGNEEVKTEEFFTSFVELELELDNIMYLAMLMFKYMPAHVEIISPENITLKNQGFNEIFNELTRKLHSYNEVVRTTQVEKEILERKLKDLLEKKGN